MYNNSMSSFLTRSTEKEKHIKPNIRVKTGLAGDVASPDMKVMKDAKTVADMMATAGHCAATATGTARILDGSFNNSRLKSGLSDPGFQSAEFVFDMITFNRPEITNIYHGSWVFRRIIDKVAQDMWSTGITINVATDPVELQKVYTKLARLRSELIYATQQGRLYGGAGSLMMVNDGVEDLSKPLNLAGIQKGAALKLFTLDRWYGLEPSTELVMNYKSADFGKPMYYTFFMNNNVKLANDEPINSIKVHHSRVLRFVNRRSPKLVEQMLMGWGISELEHIYQDLMNHENTKSSSASLLGKALLEIVKVEGIRGMVSGLALGSTNAQSQLAGHLTAINNFRNTNNLVLLDSDDEYNNFQYTFSGLPELLEQQKDLIAGAAEMPKVLLYGDTKGGLTSDSPAEMEFYAGTILGKQDSEVRPVLNKLLPVLFRICGLEIPKGLDFEFESLAGMTQDKKINLLNATITSATTMVEAGLMTSQTALEEIAQVQKQTGFGTNITERDKALAEDQDKHKDEMPPEDETIEDDDEDLMQVNNDYKEAVDEVVKKEKRRLFDKLKRNKK